MKCIGVLLFVTLFGGTWRLGRPTCVLESDFGFILNCAFKKSGLFRVRNLGGVKAHIGLGFSVGDELGFKESISNLEINRRRSTQTSKVQAQLIEAQQKLNPSPGSSINREKIETNPQDNSLKRSASSIATPTAGGAMMNVPPEVLEAMRASKRSSQSQPQPPAVVPPFKPIPPAPERPSITPSKIPTPALTGPTFPVEPDTKPKIMTVMVPKAPKEPISKLSSTNFALRTLPSPNNELPPSNSVQQLLAANNVTEDMVQMALLQRQQVLNRMKTSTTTATPRPVAPNKASSFGKVMNAPKEYYPVGYDKNFDDNFASRVELPETSFYCGDQKHFPGLYADEDLGCMVFHVCALTDDGLIMKSFLCPESTLFDQTILKCNWWFYVDCKNSKKLYDSNIPISKSYQLMKALTFFSSYKKDANGNSTAPKTNDKD